jgi:hypothetical protein
MVKDKQRSTKRTYKTKDRVTRTPLNLTIGVALQNVWDFSNIQSFGSFGQTVSEEKIKKIGQSETRIAYGGHVC